jgi:hypothetical protein
MKWSIDLMPILLALLGPLMSAIVPALAKKATSALVGNAEMLTKDGEPLPGEEKKKWVLNFFNSLQDILAAHGLLSPKAAMIFDSLEGIVSEEIERQLEKLKKKNA